MEVVIVQSWTIKLLSTNPTVPDRTIHVNATEETIDAEVKYHLAFGRAVMGYTSAVWFPEQAD